MNKDALLNWVIIGVLATTCMYLAIMWQGSLTVCAEEMVEVECGTQDTLSGSIVPHPILPGVDIYGKQISNYTCQLVCEEAKTEGIED